ncbi:uncharacterized protein MELLADRAFT_68266 [Melampsora larici-populina 98AG31]|uniref:Uncharacterized protein n=1 Tax=Melampsora larici-populina (strain 98AG31 / pathotype 3-4-7) TaxID=747676 RepID=F4S657_MELLP|nr:uncharacterized protein MELLADRAFT_68266 [Melampsora larici-populina 98AG31]EGF99877.1 hypothetical protein MELLADRAFT_68266 [Melampsora larici-populina 98AG31]
MTLYQFFMINCFCSSILRTYCSPLDGLLYSIDANSKVGAHSHLRDTPYTSRAHVDQLIHSDSDHLVQDKMGEITSIDDPTLSFVQSDQKLDVISHKKQKVTVTGHPQTPEWLGDNNFSQHGRINKPASVQQFEFFPTKSNESVEKTFQEVSPNTFHHPKTYNEEKRPLQLLPEFHQEEHFSNLDTLLSIGPPSKPSDRISDTESSTLMIKPLDTAAEVEEQDYGTQKSDQQSGFEEVPKEYRLGACYQSAMYILPRVGELIVQSHGSLSKQITPWLHKLNKQIGPKIQSLSIPYDQKDKIQAQISDAIEVQANSIVTPAFLACLKFAYHRKSEDLKSIYDSGWKFISSIFEAWQDIDLKGAINKKLKSISKKKQRLDPVFMLSYILTSNYIWGAISMTFLWKLCDKWDKTYSKDKKTIPLELDFKNFSQRILSGIKKEGEFITSRNCKPLRVMLLGSHKSDQRMGKSTKK